MASTRKAPPRVVVGQPLAPAAERALLVALRPMLADIRATLPRIRTEADVKAFGVALKRRWSDAKIAELVKDVGKKVERAASMPWRTIAARADKLRKTKRDAKGDVELTEYDGDALVDAWSKEAASLIKSVREEIAETLRADVVHALDNDIDPSTLAAKWIAQGVPVKFGTVEGRMKVIAQNQIARLNAEVQRTRAGAVGATEFVWHHSGQPSPPARAEHRALDGVKVSYAEPPKGVLPGVLPNCKCWAESVIPDDVAAALGLGSIFDR